MPTGRLFVGRDAELARLLGFVTDSAPHGGFIAVQGDGGIGKSSLIDAALAQLPRRHQVLRGAADAMDRRRAYGIHLDALAPKLTLEDHRIAAERSEHLAGERLLEVIDACTREPTILVLEDLHWADPGSLRLLTKLSRTLEQMPLTIIASLRTQARHETAPALDHLLSVLSERGLLHVIDLQPLTESTCLHITEHLIGGRADDSLARYTASAGGNPLFLTELIRALVQDGAVTLGPRGEARLDAPAGPSPSLAMVMMRHLSHLTPATRELLTTAALLGTRFPPAQLRLVADRTMSDLVPMLREAFAAGFLEEIDDDTLGFRHQLIQEVLLHDMPAAVRGELHRDVALRLEAAGLSPATVAGHLLHAPVAAEDLTWMLALAERTAAAAPGTADELWQRVAAHTAPASLMHVTATAGLARTALSAGRPAEAAALATSALQHESALRQETALSGADRIGPLLRAVETRALLLQHQHDAARDRALGYAASKDLAAAEQAAHLTFAAWPVFMLGDIDSAVRFARQGAALAAEQGNHGARVYGLSLLGLIANCRGELDEAISVLSEAVLIADQHPSLASIEAFPHAQLAVALADVDRTAESAALVQRGMAVSAQFGYRTGLLATHSLAAQARSHSGNLSDIAVELDAHRTLLGSMDIRLDPPVRGLRTQVIARQRGPAAAQEAAAQLDPVPGREQWGGRGRSWVWLGHSQPDRARRDDAATLDVLWRGWQEFRAGELLMDCAELALDLVELARRMPDERSDADERITDVVSVISALAAKNPSVAHLQSTALAVSGVAAGDAAALVEAERLMALTPRRLDHARIAELAALALPASDAGALAETALRAYAEVGADHEAARSRASFRRAGVAVQVMTRARATSGWEALTRTEERIAGHVAEGETNLEIAQSLFISRRTVETHVSNILTKLGLRSRTELAILIARRLDDPGQHGE
ncbi:LuxR family transcriptional regulator [Microbacterium sp. H1-D42]|uniref:helix-turn-helix transcriptional regulator n=1 Tax=Microbacterium sp. H1-D42 TaxID=2925844 RepID=UPI001F537DE4|nr:LuxR family transcriptional regulator [Microbacterium sp. H1-D42]UNK71482.1 AAA family ATPase [Microbacterium sp. H1-D42]